MNRVIILNKPFLGGWLNKDGNIAHEIINFFKSDNGKMYAYNNPWGHCPSDIYVGTPNEKEKYCAKYLVLTSNFKVNTEANHGGTTNVLYVLELSKKMHNLHYVKEEETNKRNENEKFLESVILENQIKYNDKYLNKIYQNDGSLYLTFEVSKVYKAKLPIPFKFDEYTFQRNKGYLYEHKEENKNDFNKLNKAIEQWIINKDLEELKLEPLSNQSKDIILDNCFVEMIGVESKEQTYSNMLFNLLKYKPFLKLFLEEITKWNISVDDIKVSKEKYLGKGRADITIESDNYRLVIENKVYSGLNGLDLDKNTSQLQHYYDWCSKAANNKCYILVPDFRKKEIREDIDKFNHEMNNKFDLLTYSDICNLIDKAIKNQIFKLDFKYKKFLNEIYVSFKKYSQENLLDIYASMFLNVTNRE